MNPIIVRGIKNIWRNPIRSLLIMVVLGLAVAVFTSLQNIAPAVDQETARLARELETLIQVRPAGYIGMGLVPRTIYFNTKDYELAKTVPSVISIERQIAEITTDDKFVPPVSVHVGIEPGKPLRIGGGELSSTNIVQGRNFTPEEEKENTVIIGRLFAEQRGALIGKAKIELGDEIPIRNEKFRVIGIFSFGQSSFVENQVFMPISVFNRLYEVGEGRTAVFNLRVDSVNNVTAVVEEVKNRFGERIDLITGQSRIEVAQRELGKIAANTTVGAFLSVFAAFIVIFFAMLVVTRERTREIGTLKALGAARSDIALQFVTESSALAMLGGLLGAFLFFLLLPFISSVLLTQEISALEIKPSINFAFIFYGIILALILGVLGSLYPALRAAKTDPAEALRYE